MLQYACNYKLYKLYRREIVELKVRCKNPPEKLGTLLSNIQIGPLTCPALLRLVLLSNLCFAQTGAANGETGNTIIGWRVQGGRIHSQVKDKEDFKSGFKI